MSLTTLNPNVANKLVLEQFVEGFYSYVPMGDVLFQDRTPERSSEKFGVDATDGSVSSVDESANYPEVTNREAGTKTLSTLTFKKKVSCSKKMKAYDNYGKVARNAFKLAYQARYQIDHVKAGVLNNGDSSTAPYGVFDGLSLLNASHVIGDTGLTQSNNIGGNLTSANLETAISRLNTMKDHSNLVMPSQGKYLVVHPDNHKEAFELIGSPDAPDTADRAKNFFNGMGIQIISWPLLSVATTWFLIGKPNPMHDSLISLMKIAPNVEFVDGSKTTNGSDEYRLDFEYEAGAVDYLGVVGNIV